MRVPTFAELHEISDTMKVSHEFVGYVKKSREPDQKCGNCRNFICRDKVDGGNRCATVQSPIGENAWCQRFARN
jgi:hypothetical protein